MNYIDPTLEVPQLIAINTNAVGGSLISWTLTMEGNDDVSFSFNSTTSNFQLVDMGYFQSLSCDFFTEGIDLDPERFYVLKGTLNGSVVYVGKIFVTERDIDDYSVHQNKYTPKNSTNNFVILD